MSVPFSVKVPVRFGDVDHAGLVYYPRYFQYFHNAFEDLIAAGGVGYRRLLDERRLGCPTVNASCDYLRPLRWEDVVEIAVSVVKIGRSSAVLRYRGSLQGAQVCEAQVTVVCTNLDTFRSEPWPADLRAIWENHLEEPRP